MKEFKVTKINDPVFDNFLKKHKIKDKFINNCNNTYSNCPKKLSIDEISDVRKDVELKSVDPDVIAKAFPWDVSPKGEEFWGKLNNIFTEAKLKKGL